jgi:NADPH:quinone reductase-like Zn-dependent oxidoreductase
VEHRSTHRAVRVAAGNGTLTKAEVSTPEPGPGEVRVRVEACRVCYQHDRWIGEVRERDLGHALPDTPGSDRLRTVDGYLVVCGWAE